MLSGIQASPPYGILFSIVNVYLSGSYAKIAAHYFEFKTMTGGSAGSHQDGYTNEPAARTPASFSWCAQVLRSTQCSARNCRSGDLFHHVTGVDGRCHFDPERLRRRGNDRHFRPPLRNREALRGPVGRAVIDDPHAAGTGRVRGHGASPLGRRRVGLHLLAEAINRIARTSRCPS